MDRYPVWLRLLITLMMVFFMSVPAFCQDDGDDGDDGDDDDETPQLTAAGVLVNPEGVLSILKEVDVTGALARQRRREAVATLGRELAKPSGLRKISLNRLEKVLGETLASGQAPTDEMKYLAGMTRLQYVFYYPESNDIVIAGPAEGFMLDGLNRPVGISSGRSVLQLEDLVVALRAFGPSGESTQHVGVSIDPTEEGLQRMQQYLNQLNQGGLPGSTAQLTTGLQRSLGKQTVTVRGISPNTHFANVLVEADYRMKLIGIGLEQPPVRIASYVKLARPTRSGNAMQRWYFVPDYESVLASDDGFAIELIGEGVKLVEASEVVQADGRRVASRKVDPASQRFVRTFTQLYPQLALKMPVYAQMRNMIDMLIASAYIQQQDFYGQAGWSMDVLGNEQLYPVEIYYAPKQVESAVNAVWKGNVLMTPIGGGVSINPLRAVSAQNIQPDIDGKVSAAQKKVGGVSLEEGQWWWD